MDIKIIKPEKKKSGLLKTWENTHNFWIMLFTMTMTYSCIWKVVEKSTKKKKTSQIINKIYNSTAWEVSFQKKTSCLNYLVISAESFQFHKGYTTLDNCKEDL